MDSIECPYCGSAEVDWVDTAGLYQCAECDEWFEDEVPDIEEVRRPQRTKMHRDE